MTGIQGKSGKVAAALAAFALVAVPALAVAQSAKRPPAVSLSFDRMASFTPASADPRLAAAFAGRSLGLDDFKFTPAPAKGRPSQVRVAVRARTLDAPRPVDIGSAPTAGALTPASYNLGVAVGWKRFAVSGDVAKATSIDPALGTRQSAVVGVSYNLKKFTGRVAVGAERSEGRIAALGRPDNVSLDVGAAYNISRRVALTGGVRYRVDQDRIAALADQRRDSQAVYVGTAFKF